MNPYQMSVRWESYARKHKIRLIEESQTPSKNMQYIARILRRYLHPDGSEFIVMLRFTDRFTVDKIHAGMTSFQVFVPHNVEDLT